MAQLLASTYRRAFLERPWSVLAVLCLLLGFFAFHARDFQLDASAESLLLEDDRDLQLFREVSARYDSQSLLIVTFSPDAALFSDESLERLARLRDELRAVSGVASLTTILDVPLLKSGDVPLLELIGNVPTLESDGVDRARAMAELQASPVYRSLLLSRDGRTTALLLTLEPDEGFVRLQRARNQLLIRRGAEQLSSADLIELPAVSAAYNQARHSLGARRSQEIAQIRTILAGYRPHGRLHLGGAAMITDDMISFVRSDLVVFGSGVFVFIVLVLMLIFRQLRWVLLPLLSCAYAAVAMIGILGLFGWEVTVISSNFLALMLIITISMNIHLSVRYRQIEAEQPDTDHVELVATTVARMVRPCFYTALTTIIGFGSLVFSQIKPVQDFGWIMGAGLTVAFVTSFTLFPAALVLLPRGRIGDHSRELPFTAALAYLTERQGGAIFACSGALLALGLYGISLLTVENAFINYFRSGTEIYQGMRLIDRELGGTTPLEILVHYGEEDDDAGLDEEDEDFEDWDVASGPENWFTPFKIGVIKRAHDYLEALPEVGKVLSLASVIRIAEDLNDGEELDGLELAVLYKKLPREVLEPLIEPYFSFEHNEARIELRIRDSQEGLRRVELLQRIREGLASTLELPRGTVTLTGALVLYNNMLQSLYRSQITSLGAVLLGIALTLLFLFRSLRLALIGIVPQILAAVFVLGLMGLLGIPLDMMTITIAAITIGIAVDNAIHYIYRFREEFAHTGDYVETLRICHATIGRAVFYTSATIIFGFSILAMSNFWPTIYFGVLTGMAMAMALAAALTLLPRLILLIRPFPES